MIRLAGRRGAAGGPCSQGRQQEDAESNTDSTHIYQVFSLYQTLLEAGVQTRIRWAFVSSRSSRPGARLSIKIDNGLHIKGFCGEVIGH